MMEVGKLGVGVVASGTPLASRLLPCVGVPAYAQHVSQ